MLNDHAQKLEELKANADGYKRHMLMVNQELVALQKGMGQTKDGNTIEFFKRYMIIKQIIMQNFQQFVAAAVQEYEKLHNEMSDSLDKNKPQGQPPLDKPMDKAGWRK